MSIERTRLNIPSLEQLTVVVDIPGYDILGELGRGGMGVVIKARHRELGGLCALKMVLAGVHADDAQRERFLAEARAVAALQHLAIVPFYEIGQHPGGAQFLMCDGSVHCLRYASDPLLAALATRRWLVRLNPQPRG